MRLTREIAREQLARLASSPMLFPQSAEGKIELLDCLMRNCVDAEHCADTMTRLLDDVTDPKSLTAAIAAIAWQTRRPDQPPPGCEECGLGLNQTSGVMEYLPYISVQLGGCSFARRCGCARGRWLAARDYERANRSASDRASLAPPRQLDFKAMASGDEAG